MTTDIEKAAEKRGYSKGYAAGQRRQQFNITRDRQRKIDERRRDQFFCAALNGLLPNAGWTMSKKELSSLADYVELAARFADESLQALRRRPLP